MHGHRRSPEGGRRYGGEGKRTGRSEDGTGGVPPAPLSFPQSPAVHHWHAEASCGVGFFKSVRVLLKGFDMALLYCTVYYRYTLCQNVL